MPGLVLNDRATYWVWSTHGPAHDGIYYGFPFVNGMIPAPVCSRDAEALRAQGYQIQEYAQGTWVTHWEHFEGAWRPVFAPIREESGETDDLPSLAGVDLPARLPDEYLSLLRSYTASGKLRQGRD